MAPATLKDVANICGVSVATASRAINNRGEVNPVTRQRVLKAAKELGYVPSSLAKGLWSGKTKVVGVLITTIENPFYANVVSGIEKVLSEKDYNILLCSSYEDPRQELAALRVLLQQRVDGLILAPVQSKPEVVESLQKNSVPFVLVGRNIPGIETNYVVCDDQKIGEMAAEHFLTQGHKQVLFINSSRNYSAQLRLRGFINVMQKHGIKVEHSWIKTVPPHENAKYTLFQALDQGLHPSAVFCFCDHMALEVIQGIHELGLRIPEDMAVMGVDNLDVTGIVDPPLTTIDTQISKMGIKTAEILLHNMENPGTKVQQFVLEPVLIERSSS